MPLGWAACGLGGLIGPAINIKFYNRTLYRSGTDIDTLVLAVVGFIGSEIELYSLQNL